MAMLVDPLISEALSKLSDAIIFVAQTTANFKPQLKQLKLTLDRINPIIDEILKLNRRLDRTRQESEMFITELEDAETLVRKCLKIKWNYFKRFTHSLKLKDVDQKLLRFFQIEVQANQSRDIKETLVEMKDVNQRMSSLSVDMKDLRQTLSSGYMSISSRSDYGEFLRGKFGWRVPVVPGDIVAFEEPLAKLKARVLADDDEDDGLVVVVSAAGGCGKTTLVTMLCNDPDIQDKFGEYIFYVTVSETPNFMVIINDLFNPDSFGQQVAFQSDEDAKNKLGIFLREKVSSPILLVLDDVWSESFIKKFTFDMKGYKIVVTSRTKFLNYDVFEFEPLSDEDAKKLFSRSAFGGGKSKHRPTIAEDVVNQMVACCKKHPLTLSVVGSSLNGKNETTWKSMLRSLSQGQLVLDLNKDVLNRLERSFEALDENFKQCFLDFGLFPEDQRIPASALLNMWVHLYNHDDEGTDTITKICELSYRNLVTFMTTGNDSSAIVNFCEQQFVTQHDLLRELAINLNSKLPISERTRLIINVREEDLPKSIEEVEEPMKARILSISTESSFSSRWCNMKVPEVEVLVLNFTSKTYSLPHFLDLMQKLKILNVANYGSYPTKLENFHILGCLSNLTRIRLERVAISSLKSISELENLQKISFIMCKMVNAFDDSSTNTPNHWPKLVEIEIDYCQDLVKFPGMLCSSPHLKKLSITNCNEMCGLSDEIGELTNLEILSLRSCTKLGKLPESITKLQKLSVLDISDCLSLNKLPKQIGNLGGLRTIYMKGCTGVYELPQSVEELCNIQVICNEEISYQWRDFPNVKINIVEEDRLGTLLKII